MWFLVRSLFSHLLICLTQQIFVVPLQRYLSPVWRKAVQKTRSPFVSSGACASKKRWDSSISGLCPACNLVQMQQCGCSLWKFCRGLAALDERFCFVYTPFLHLISSVWLLAHWRPWTGCVYSDPRWVLVRLKTGGLQRLYLLFPLTVDSCPSNSFFP